MTFEGEWESDFRGNGEQHGNKVHLLHGKKGRAVYPLPVDKPGRYRLHAKVSYEWHLRPGHPVRIEVVSEGKRCDFEFDQAIECGLWRLIGECELRPGARLTIVADEKSENVIADGFALEAIGNRGEDSETH